MKTFVARQPIFNINKNIEFYELLFRNSQNNYYNSMDGDNATLEVIASTFTLIGTNKLTNGKRAFINFTEKLILEEAPLMLPSDKIAIEILEDVKPSARLIETCKKLKSLGYVLVLDDFIFKPCYEPLMEFIDFIKIDFLQTKGIDRKLVIKNCKNKNINFIAEKIETIEEFNEAVSLGYTYFQGYFFSRPTVLSSKSLSANMSTYFKLLNSLNKEEELDNVENIIKTDVSLCYKLLKFINSAHFGLKRNINSISHAMALLGRKELLKWATLVGFGNIVSNDNDSIMEEVAARAKFGEGVANRLGFSNRASEIFIMELFSSIDELLGESMEEILIDLPIEEDIKAGLCGEDNTFSNIRNLISCYEKARWEEFSKYAGKLNIDEAEIPAIYGTAVEWASDLIATI